MRQLILCELLLKVLSNSAGVFVHFQPSLKFAPNLTYKYQVWLKMIVSDKHASLLCVNDLNNFYQTKLEYLYTSSLILSLLLASPSSTKFV
jgi:hypothetical protein